MVIVQGLVSSGCLESHTSLLIWSIFGFHWSHASTVWALGMAFACGDLPLLLEWSWIIGKGWKWLVKAGTSIGEVSMNEFLSGSWSCLTRSRKKFLTMLSFSVHENSLSSIATENLLLMLCTWVISHCWICAFAVLIWYGFLMSTCLSSSNNMVLIVAFRAEVAHYLHSL